MVRFTLWLIATTAFLKTSSAGIQERACKNYNCESGHVCVLRFSGRTCAVKEGLPCTFFDYCEGGYYCRNREICTGGPVGIPEGENCNGGGCRLGFYCDQIQKKCLQIYEHRRCSINSHCENGCPSAQGCYCHALACTPKP